MVTVETFQLLGQRVPAKSVSAQERAQELIRKGLPARVIALLAKRFDVGPEVIRTLLGISKSTAARKVSQAAPLRSHASDRAFRLAQVLALANHVFEDDVDAREWFKKPIWALDGARPLDLLDTEVGTQRVVQVLNQVEYGVF